jgi:hypothetical protein
MRDEDFGEAFDRLLTRYRFTPREETSTWQEAAIDQISPPSTAHGIGRTQGDWSVLPPLALVARVTDAASGDPGPAWCGRRHHERRD